MTKAELLARITTYFGSNGTDKKVRDAKDFLIARGFKFHIGNIIEPPIHIKDAADLTIKETDVINYLIFENNGQGCIMFLHHISFEGLTCLQYEFSTATFGPGHRTNMVLDHLEKELKEIRENPDDLEEWIDAMILVLDGMLRRGLNFKDIEYVYHMKLLKNMRRKWPDWRTADPNKAIHHIKTEG